MIVNVKSITKESEEIEIRDVTAPYALPLERPCEFNVKASVYFDDESFFHGEFTFPSENFEPSFEHSRMRIRELFNK